MSILDIVPPGESLTKWWIANEPDEKYIYAKAAGNQLCFFRDTLIRGILSRKNYYEQPSGVEVNVIGTHMSKGIVLPVVEIIWRRKCRFVLRDNFYDYKLTVECQDPIVGLEISDLCKTTEEINSIYCEGFRPQDVHPSYSRDQSYFTLEVYSHYALFTIMFLIHRKLLQMYPEEGQP